MQLPARKFGGNEMNVRLSVDHENDGGSGLCSRHNTGPVFSRGGVVA